MKTTKQYRQGDVLIEQIDQLPTKPKSKGAARVILAFGTATGHSHEIEDPTSAAIEASKEVAAPGDLKDAGTMTNSILALKADTAVIHHEHSRIELPSGNYIVRIQREYTPTEIRNVQD